MEQSEFSELCKSAKPISINCDYYGDIKIIFDNKIEVEISITTDYDCHIFEFESNIEKDNKMIEWQKREDIKKENLKKFEEEKKRIMSKFTDEQWKEIEQAFLYNNGMTYEQNKKLQEESHRFYKSINDKYGDEGSFKKLSELM